MVHATNFSQMAGGGGGIKFPDYLPNKLELTKQTHPAPIRAACVPYRQKVNQSKLSCRSFQKLYYILHAHILEQFTCHCVFFILWSSLVTSQCKPGWIFIFWSDTSCWATQPWVVNPHTLIVCSILIQAGWKPVRHLKSPPNKFWIRLHVVSKVKYKIYT